MTRAFTLVELLVVITIIVLLLVLLGPALYKAIYQAELTVCEARLHAVAQGVTTYAFGNRRYYPYRPGIYYNWTWRETNIATVAPFGDATTDDRPILKDIFPINATLNCPLTKA